MILDTLNNAHKYVSLHPQFGLVFDYLLHTDFSALTDGRKQLNGTDVYIDLATIQGREHAPLEAHRQYIDIQLPLSGIESIGWKPVSACQCPTEPYDATRDIIFFDDTYDTIIPVGCGQFVVFFPDDAHAPAMTTGTLRKLVAKIRI
ncbi:MAG: YhcH/YjgK/YiaL family protein [Paludibacteraceae bacterium]